MFISKNTVRWVLWSVATIFWIAYYLLSESWEILWWQSVILAFVVVFAVLITEASREFKGKSKR